MKRDSFARMYRGPTGASVRPPSAMCFSSGTELVERMKFGSSRVRQRLILAVECWCDRLRHSTGYFTTGYGRLRQGYEPTTGYDRATTGLRQATSGYFTTDPSSTPPLDACASPRPSYTTAADMLSSCARRTNWATCTRCRAGSSPRSWRDASARRVRAAPSRGRGASLPEPQQSHR